MKRKRIRVVTCNHMTSLAVAPLARNADRSACSLLFFKHHCPGTEKISGLQPPNGQIVGGFPILGED